ncbi:CotO family spore coat protein [Neobacillus sp.]|uniref:CotO family spore coat protein n=1 Tax=Neobacillus sp. TaxID=2675273 RepID=UPI002899F393|nr:CotO family spore coat protein [Neobacillus sp.]
MSKKKSIEPLIYVNQSFSRTTSNKNMQEIYTSKQEKEHLIEEKAGNVSKRKISLAKKELKHEPIPIEVVNSENPQPISSAQDQKQRASFKRVKPFKEMELNERLDYLINFPKVLPPVPCVFYTAEESYQGYLVDYDNHQLTIQFHDQTSKTLSLNELKDVIMIGIKK